jgi:protein SCO1
MDAQPPLPRRRLLRLGLAVAMARTGLDAQAATLSKPESNDPSPKPHFPFGPVVPARRAGAWPVKTQNGLATDLSTLLLGKVTAMQLMFTGCSATCPLQGALFAQAQRDPAAAEVTAQFVSLSIDPLADTPAALAGWLRKFAAQPGWLAVAPRIEDVAAIIAWLTRGGESRPIGDHDPHTGQVYVIDRRGELVFRLASMPPASDIAAVLRSVARRG